MNAGNMAAFCAHLKLVIKMSILLFTIGAVILVVKQLEYHIFYAIQFANFVQGRF